MEQPIYADLLFLINFSMDFLTLFLCAQLLHLTLPTYRAVLGAGIGGVYGVASLFLPLGTMRSLGLNFAVALLMCALTFAPKKLAHWVKVLFLYYGVGFLLGGSMTAIYHLCNQYLHEHRIYFAGNYQTLQADPSALAVLMLACASALLAMLIGRIFFHQSKVTSRSLLLRLEERDLTLTAFVDSGNLLKDPVSGCPVFFVQYEAVKTWLSLPLRDFFASPSAERLTKLSAKDARRIRMLPVSTVGKRSLLFCLRPDWIKVDGTSHRALLAIVASVDREFGGYPALICDLPT